MRSHSPTHSHVRGSDSSDNEPSDFDRHGRLLTHDQLPRHSVIVGEIPSLEGKERRRSPSRASESHYSPPPPVMQPQQTLYAVQQPMYTQPPPTQPMGDSLEQLIKAISSMRRTQADTNSYLWWMNCYGCVTMTAIVAFSIVTIFVLLSINHKIDIIDPVITTTILDAHTMLSDVYEKNVTLEFHHVAEAATKLLSQVSRTLGGGQLNAVLQWPVTVDDVMQLQSPDD
jgi:hypothetical protein